MRKGQAEVAGRRRQFRGTGLSWTLVLALVMAAAIVVGVIQNSHGVRLDYLVWHGSVPLIAVLLATVVLTVALTSLVGVIWRGRRRHQMTDSAELGELRGQAKPQEGVGRPEGAPAHAEVMVGIHNPGATSH
jgi:uncharacterized integral membrane protein